MALVTILCDASYCAETKAGGYGFWIASNLGKTGGGGEFRKLFDNSIGAEMAAVVNTVVISVRKSYVFSGDHMLIQTDCMAAIDRFLNRNRCGSTQEIEAMEFFHDFIASHNLTFRFKHVKGHTGNNGARFRANNHCDEHAKTFMRAMRKRIRGITL